MNDAPAVINYQKIGPRSRHSSAARGFSNGALWQRAADDFYVEPESATTALLNAEWFIGTIWDPAAGSGNVVKACRATGRRAFGSDKVVRQGLPDLAIGDFLDLDGANLPWGPVDCIISNPPFKLAEPFIEKALSIARFKVAFLLRTAFLEGQGRHERIFSKTPLKRVWQFRGRLSMPPGGAAIEARGGAVAFAWFVWDHGWQGPPQIGWL